MIPQDLAQIIWEQYKPEAGDVLWVGSLIDGLAYFLADDLFPNIPAHAHGERRKRIKGLLADVRMVRKENEPAMHYSAVRVVMQRQGWPSPLYLTSQVVDVEYGALRNSPHRLENVETGEVVWEPAPLIILDKRWGLHYLLRGDAVTVEIVHRNTRHVKYEFQLRPKSEGSSLIQAEKKGDITII
jgi:hypothetical protein